MEREFLATGKTVEEAIEAAYEKAGVDREYVTVEIVERPKKKFFGLKTVPATAKAIIDEDYWNKMFGVKEKKAEAPKKKKEVKEKLCAPYYEPVISLFGWWRKPYSCSTDTHKRIENSPHNREYDVRWS